MKTAKPSIYQAIIKITFFLTFLLVPVGQLFGSTEGSNSGHGGGESFEPGPMIMHHIKDDYRWHFFTAGDFHATLYFPVILYEQGNGFSAFSSRHLYHSEDDSHQGYKLDGNEIKAINGGTVYDLSMTKNVVSMLISVLLMIFIFIKVANRYKRDPSEPPKGIQSLLEPVIIFIRDEVAKPTLGDRWFKYFPYIITVFFFVWINNLLGLLPGAANVTGNIAFTACLALLTLIITNISATKTYWQHIFNTPGVPLWLKFPIPLMPLVEFIGIFTKPFALAIRLFANMMAGHILILSIVSLIFIFGQSSPALGLGVVSPLSVVFTIFVYLIKLLVAAVQAYIFAMLSAVFIGEAITEHH